MFNFFQVHSPYYIGDFVIYQQLKEIVSDPSHISLQTTHILSEKKISCQTVINEEKTVIIFNPTNTAEKSQIKMNAEGVSPHPNRSIIAVRGGKEIQVFNLESSTRTHKCSFSDPIDYMTWSDESHLAVITTASAFLLDITKEDQPKQVFERVAALEGHVIVNFQTDKSNNWCLLHGNMYDVCYASLFVLLALALTLFSSANCENYEGMHSNIQYPQKEESSYSIKLLYPL